MNLLSNIKNVAITGKLLGMKYSPHILVGAGVIGVVASTVMACKATLKVQSVIDASNKDLEEVHKGHETGKTVNGECYSEDDYKRDLVVVQVQKWTNLAKLYAPAAGLGMLSVAAILGSHGIMTRRNTALMAAYQALNLGFQKYRNNVITQLGPEKDEEFRYGIREKVLETPVISDDGEEVVQTTKRVPTHGSEYSVWFDQNSVQFRNDPVHNLWFLTDVVQRHMNDKLTANGILFLNEVYEALGVPKTSSGQVVGWVKNSKTGDGYVDLGLDNPINRGFLKGETEVALLDFNVDGPVWDEI